MPRLPILGSDSPQSKKMLRVTPFSRRETHNVPHSIASCFRATTANISACTADSACPDTGAALAPATDTWRLQPLLDDCCRLVLPYHDVKQATNGADTCDTPPPPVGTENFTASNHPGTPPPFGPSLIVLVLTNPRVSQPMTRPANHHQPS